MLVPNEALTALSSLAVVDGPVTVILAYVVALSAYTYFP